MKAKPYYKFGIQHGVSQCLHAFCENCFERSQAIWVQYMIYGFELEFWEAEFLAEFHVACSEFIST